MNIVCGDPSDEPRLLVYHPSQSIPIYKNAYTALTSSSVVLFIITVYAVFERPSTLLSHALTPVPAQTKNGYSAGRTGFLRTFTPHSK